MELKDYLLLLARHDGSDIYLSTGAPPCAKFQGVLRALDKDPLAPGRVKEIAYSVMDAAQIAEFERTLEMNLAIGEIGVGRFRVNIFKQRGEVSMVIRNIKTDIPTVADLGLPPVLTEVIMAKRGLILFVGGTGSGKSTSLAALIDHRNTNSGGHIITIEDPVEFVHRHKRSVVNQREIGVDTLSYADALKNTLRQAPDVILIGEIRDRETMEHALAFAETGHLAISTLHANSANQALDRIINFFPEERRSQLLTDLSSNLRAFISQRLIPTIDGKRVAAIEILLHSPMVETLIKRGEVSTLKEIMEKAVGAGMQTFDQALFNLHQAGKISLDEAIKNADSANNLRLRINLSGGSPSAQREGGSGLSLEAMPEPEEEKPAAPPAPPPRMPLRPGGG
ncbi:MAG: PilT/PilU family type 4a pilus ATPase [Candidatus Contendobacter sp.]|jgi:twitching motility protein PilU|nr:PilT/PilU family type 4a pilus ATPase [Gammaproteobacteria bacterium]MCC8993276.1 PilT/PilU family type 4a pilus ATPase [Candidatus Contendobacter sp.]